MKLIFCTSFSQIHCWLYFIKHWSYIITTIRVCLDFWRSYWFICLPQALFLNKVKIHIKKNIFLVVIFEDSLLQMNNLWLLFNPYVNITLVPKLKRKSILKIQRDTYIKAKNNPSNCIGSSAFWHDSLTEMCARSPAVPRWLCARRMPISLSTDLGWQTTGTHTPHVSSFNGRRNTDWYWKLVSLYNIDLQQWIV